MTPWNSSSRFGTAAVHDIAAMPLDTWILAWTHRLNVLLVGPEATTSAFLDACRPYLQHPVTEVGSREPIVVPDAQHVGTLLVPEIDTLSAGDQRRLLEWFERNTDHRRQVISTSAVPVLPMMVAGAFTKRLYYRLNTVYVDLTAASSCGARSLRHVHGHAV
jgi:hypothetical protein